jgi:hypothetical protein
MPPLCVPWLVKRFRLPGRASRNALVPTLALLLGVLIVLSLFLPVFGGNGFHHPASHLIADGAPGCGWSWLNESALRIHTENGLCGSTYSVQWGGNGSGLSWSSMYNFSLFPTYLVEVSPSGEIVQTSPIGWSNPDSNFVNGTSSYDDEVNYYSSPVEAGSGRWSPETVFGSPSTWTPWPQETAQGNQSAPNVTTKVEFNLTLNSTGSVKFSFDAFGWDWANTSDTLGLVLCSIASVGTHFVYNDTAGELTESVNATGQPAASLIAGTGATAIQANGSESPVEVTSEAFLWPNTTTAGNPSGGQDALLLLNFTRQPGGYESLYYDPWIVFDLGSSSNSGQASGLIVAAALGAVLVAIGVSLVLSMIAVRARRTSPEEGFASLTSARHDARLVP